MVEGTGKIGFMKGEGVLTLTPQGRTAPKLTTKAKCRWAEPSQQWASG